MNRKWISTAVTAAMLVSLTVPVTAWASNIDINRELANIKKLEEQAAANKKAAEARKKELAAQRSRENQSIQELLRQIDEQGAKLAVLNGQIADTTEELQEADKQLEEAEVRVASRDELLKSRVKLMYTNGFVSYMDVLLNATSFSDFLDRYYALQMIVGQDKEILEANKADRKLMKEKQEEIAAKLEKVRGLYAEAQTLREVLIAQEQEKEKAVQILSQQEQHFEEISEEQEKLLAELARKRSKLYAELNKNKSNPVYSGGKLEWPLPGQFRITSQFGTRTDPFTKKKSTHKGMDIGAPQGTTIVAAESGIVLIAEWVNGYGNTVVIDHGGGLWTWYGHIRNGGIKVKEGQTVNRGDKIAEVGSTGQSTGPHLHFEVRKNEVPVDPNPYLK